MSPILYFSRVTGTPGAVIRMIVSYFHYLFSKKMPLSTKGLTPIKPARSIGKKLHTGNFSFPFSRAQSGNSDLVCTVSN